MDTLEVNTDSMDNNHNDYSSGISVVIGFVLSMTNYLYGWLSAIKITANLDTWFQTIVIGFLGATVSFFTTKLWKHLTDKKSNK